MTLLQSLRALGYKGSCRSWTRSSWGTSQERSHSRHGLDNYPLEIEEGAFRLLATSVAHLIPPFVVEYGQVLPGGDTSGYTAITLFVAVEFELNDQRLVLLHGILSVLFDLVGRIDVNYIKDMAFGKSHVCQHTKRSVVPSCSWWECMLWSRSCPRRSGYDILIHLL